ncbi:sigma-70 domain-containing protein [Conexibacter stalactiti]|uniref:Sigma-70 domain-containing protein n=1 Tax=Conexibacter stalactiti TaxID=1940611 RepID=A0ABU4HLV2_9ACTN|nr:sigma-70 domain-containing protein [Conexibacter stalactiti]MDW5594237.1 sigma-70 domain-containing protein [Conexibacter stalactiti]MEC5034879.1 sigma-70 domain-containing protein [Conexibacter stalactiti]
MAGRDDSAGQLAPKMEERSRAVARAAGALTAQTGSAPSVAQLARRTGLDLEQVAEALQASDAWDATPSDELSEQDRTVLRLRFVCELTPTEIAERLGASQPQVARALRRAAAAAARGAEVELRNDNAVLEGTWS